MTRWITGRNGPLVEVFLVGGRDHRDWIGELHTIIEMAAQDGGAIGLRAYGRLGWKRSLEEKGWRISCACYEKAL